MVCRAPGNRNGDGVCLVRAATNCGGENDARAMGAGIVRRCLGVYPNRQTHDTRDVPVPVSDAPPLAVVAARALGTTLLLMGNAETSYRIAEGTAANHMLKN